jgi:hypothetical protein
MLRGGKTEEGHAKRHKNNEEKRRDKTQICGKNMGDL